MVRILLLFIFSTNAVLFSANSIAYAADIKEEMSASSIFAEVMSSVENPHILDWRSSDLIARYGLVYYQENNDFSSSGSELIFSVPVSVNDMFSLGLRRVKVYSTYSSHLLAKTPYTQSALMSRFEFSGSYDFGLLYGRSMSLLSPFLADLETVLFATLGITYSLPSKAWYPKPNDNPDPLPGQDPVNSDMGIEVGLLWQVFFPNNFGLSLQSVYHYPFGRTGKLMSWSHLALGAVWAFGVK